MSPATTIAQLCVLIFALILPTATTATTAPTYDMDEYWFTPENLFTHTKNRFHDGSVRSGGRHGFWYGQLWGRTVRLQGDPSMSRYDIYVLNGSIFEYWGSFRGNLWDRPDSHAFDNPFRWMNRYMKVHDYMENSLTVRELSNELRKNVSTSTISMRLEILEYLPTFTIPEDDGRGLTFKDVLRIRFWSSYSTDPGKHETYHLAKGFGTVYFVSTDTEEPSGVKTSWV